MRAVRYLLALALALAPLSSEAAVVAVTAGTGTPFETVLDPTATNNISLFSLCGATTATIPVNCATQAIVSAVGEVLTSNTTIGTQADAAWTSGNGTIISLLKATVTGILGNADPCNSATRTIGLPVAFSSATTTLLATGNTGQNLYVCELVGVPNGANNITLIAGTGSTCTTPTTIGGPWYLGNAGNGLDLGKGITSFAVTQATGQNVCATTSTSAAIAIQVITVLK
jgi:hypothetical protein